MARVRTRLTAAEAAARRRNPPQPAPWHLIIQNVGQSWAEALAAYGAQKVGPEDNIVRYRIIDPRPRPGEDGWKPLKPSDLVDDRNDYDAWLAARSAGQA
jgi:hypothetical protein